MSCIHTLLSCAMLTMSDTCEEIGKQEVQEDKFRSSLKEGIGSDHASKAEGIGFRIQQILDESGCV